MLRAWSTADRSLRWSLAGTDPQGSLLDDDVDPTRELREVEYLHVRARSIISEVPAASRMPFRFTINPYRGCSHACTYCFARPTHEYLGLNGGGRLRAAHRRQGQRRRAPRGRARAAELARRAHRDGHEHRSVPAGRGALPPHARHHRDAGARTQPVLDPLEVDDGRARSRRAAGRGRAHRRAHELLDRDARRGGLAHQRARHPAALAPGRGARAAERGRAAPAASWSRRSCPGCPTARSSCRPSSRLASMQARSRSRASACTCGPACASSSCPGSRASGPISCRSTSASTAAATATSRASTSNGSARACARSSSATAAARRSPRLARGTAPPLAAGPAPPPEAFTQLRLVG